LEESSEDDESDAPVLEPGRREVVRVMNLHKAKGLEGRVVFLADPLGGVKPRADLHIAREAGRARGYLPITKAKGDWGKDILGLPAGWDALEASELDFVRAEETRLLYVAATRARETLVVSQWAGKPRSVVLPWRELDVFLKARPTLKTPIHPKPPATALPDLSDQSRRAAERAREVTLSAIRVPCFETVAISSLASQGSARSATTIDGPAGIDWGSMVHVLLEYAAGNLSASRQDLESVARWHAGDDSVLAIHVPEALDTVEKVRSAEFWRQVTTADERLTEVPVGAPWDNQTPPRLLARGFIDLALRTGEGWKIIDYKTDALGIDQLVQEYCEQLRAYARIWEKVTGKKVVFAGIYSVRDLELSPDVRGEVVTA
jgi:ATP-dependent helicase/nuclease subunit A